jgi:hypothetical protein
MNYKKHEEYIVEEEGLTDMKGIYHRVFSIMCVKRLHESQSMNRCP